jgi:hypothetical protein
MASRIAQRLGVHLPPGRGISAIEFTADPVRFVADEHVRGEGRLVLVPGGDRHDDAEAAATPELMIRGLGWATVDTERAATDFVQALDLTGTATSTDRDRLVGGYAHELRDERLPGGRLVILEPSTEGRLAASLARDGEGPAVLYLGAVDGLDAWLVEARKLGVIVSRPEAGPVGRSVLVLGGAAAGPHLVVSDA